MAAAQSLKTIITMLVLPVGKKILSWQQKVILVVSPESFYPKQYIFGALSTIEPPPNKRP